MAKKEASLFEPVDEVSLRDQVAARIRQAIDAGVLRPGERLVEADIAAQMGTSRAPVREAIRLLEQEGFVHSIPRRGSFVVELTRDDIEEIYSLRVVLEALALREALPQITTQDLSALTEMLDTMRQAADERDMARLVEYDLLFHQRIVELARHHRLADVWERMSAQLRIFLAMKDQLYENPRDVAETHVPLIEALQAGDLERAEQVMSDHIEAAGKLLLESLSESP